MDINKLDDLDPDFEKRIKASFKPTRLYGFYKSRTGKDSTGLL